MKKLKAAIVGCGRISTCYEEAFHRLSNQVQLVYAVDKDLQRAKNFADKFSCSYTDNFDLILNQGIDVVHLCLPHYLHSIMAIKAMRAGIHVLTEKPIALSLEEADKMIQEQEAAGVKLGVIFQTRYTRSVEKLKSMIEQGVFGRITSVRSSLTWNRPFEYYQASDWKGTWDKEGGGVLIDQAIHSLDRVRYMLNSDVEWIEGNIHNYVHDFINVEDTACAAIMFKNGCLYNVYACNTYGTNTPINIEFWGEKGRCGLIQDKGYFEIDGTYTEIHDTSIITDDSLSYWGDSHYIQIEDFYKSIQADTPVKVDGQEGRKTLEMVKGIYLSSLYQKRIYLPFKDITYKDLNKPLSIQI